ncbi:hypothetical protein HPP92_002405 [Vanilla planifolia]|uniref:Uncharacterized protein n=1 Tax=Vanilla planifolia TaxID=51239 RepID=A0A835RY60_VANPL|nr:hypothetical protein HPP92_002405 [Vanilla planifolia]
MAIIEFSSYIRAPKLFRRHNRRAVRVSGMKVWEMVTWVTLKGALQVGPVEGLGLVDWRRGGQRRLPGGEQAAVSVLDFTLRQQRWRNDHVARRAHQIVEDVDVDVVVVGGVDQGPGNNPLMVVTWMTSAIRRARTDVIRDRYEGDAVDRSDGGEGRTTEEPWLQW